MTVTRPWPLPVQSHQNTQITHMCRHTLRNRNLWTFACYHRTCTHMHTHTRLKGFEYYKWITAEGDNADIIYLDFRKANDTIFNYRLQVKLKSWVFLKRISNILKIGHNYSKIHNKASGNLLEYVLGPLLLLTLINEFTND